MLKTGLYSDFLQSLLKDGRMAVLAQLKSLFIEVDLNGEVESGVYPITFYFTENTAHKTKYEFTFMLEVINAVLPKQDLIYTQWFYCDCLMNYYGVECFTVGNMF